MPKTDQELIHDAEDTLQILHGVADNLGSAELNEALNSHHAALNACLNRYNAEYAPADGKVSLRSGGGKPDGP